MEEGGERLAPCRVKVVEQGIARSVTVDRVTGARRITASVAALMSLPFLLFWRLLPVTGWRPMSTMNSQVRRFRTCPLMAASLRGSAREQLTPQQGDIGPADFASAVGPTMMSSAEAEQSLNEGLERVARLDGRAVDEVRHEAIRRYLAGRGVALLDDLARSGPGTSLTDDEAQE